MLILSLAQEVEKMELDEARLRETLVQARGRELTGMYFTLEEELSSCQIRLLAHQTVCHRQLYAVRQSGKEWGGGGPRAVGYGVVGPTRYIFHAYSSC